MHEHFNPADDFSSMIERGEGPETCNTYNMLRLTEQLFRRDPNARYADYYERALFNHILSIAHPDTGGFVYFTPIRPSHYRVYSQPDNCSGAASAPAWRTRPSMASLSTPMRRRCAVRQPVHVLNVRVA